MRFQFTSVPDWPPLAWLAWCPTGSSVVTIFHGNRVEVADEWFCEAVWAGQYDSGDFDRTDIIAGSGARLREEGKAVFVSSGSTVDRLNSFEDESGVWISNSLSCLLAAVDASVDPSFPGYYRLLRTMVKGIRNYQRFLPTSAGRVQLTYFDNLVWDGRAITVQAKPGKGRDFSSFSRYYAFLQSSMKSIAENMADTGRKHPYDLLSTASSGYDSSTVTTLAKQVGCSQTLCVDHVSHEMEDSGKPLVNFLGLTPVTVKRDAWASMTLPEVPFIAADSHGGDVFFKGAEPVLAGKVLLTGFHGDKIWDKQTKDLSENIVRGDQSGLSLTDYRLMAGFIHCPVPFWGVRQISDVYAISHSREMKPWDVPGDYSRPICRRIVEEAGVPREMFGVRKLAAWVRLVRKSSFLSDQSMQNYMDWLGANRMVWVRHGRVPPLRNLSMDQLELSWRQGVKETAKKREGLSRLALRYSGLLYMAEVLYDRPTRLRRYVFPWAIEQLKKAYGRPL